MNSNKILSSVKMLIDNNHILCLNILLLLWKIEENRDNNIRDKKKVVEKLRKGKLRQTDFGQGLARCGQIY